MLPPSMDQPEKGRAKGEKGEKGKGKGGKGKRKDGKGTFGNGRGRGKLDWNLEDDVDVDAAHDHMSKFLTGNNLPSGKLT